MLTCSLEKTVQTLLRSLRTRILLAFCILLHESKRVSNKHLHCREMKCSRAEMMSDYYYYLFYNAFHTFWYYYQEKVSVKQRKLHLEKERVNCIILLSVSINNRRTMPEFVKILIWKILLFQIEMNVCA